MACLPGPKFNKQCHDDDVICSQARDKDMCSITGGSCCVWAPACNVQDGNGKCTSQVNSQGKTNCVGGDQLCGVNLAAHTKAHPDENTCEYIFNKYNKQMINCDNGYTAYVEQDNQGNCLFKCADDKQGECCGLGGNAGVCATTMSGDKVVKRTKAECTGKSCTWFPKGCNKENFRMRRWRR
jgi:hypothetical protein